MNPIFNQIDNLTNLGTSAVQTTISAYTHYVFFSSLFYVIVAAILFLIGTKLWKNQAFFESKGGAGFGVIVGVAAMIISTGIFVENFPNLISPKAVAIEKLIKNVQNKY